MRSGVIWVLVTWSGLLIIGAILGVSWTVLGIIWSNRCPWIWCGYMVDLKRWRLGGVWSWDALGWLVRELGGLIWIRRCEWSGGWWDILRYETLLRLSIAHLSVFGVRLGSLLCLITLWPIHWQLSRSCQHLNSFPCRYQISEVPISSASHCTNIRGPKSPQEIRAHLC